MTESEEAAWIEKKSVESLLAEVKRLKNLCNALTAHVEHLEDENADLRSEVNYLEDELYNANER